MELGRGQDARGPGARSKVAGDQPRPPDSKFPARLHDLRAIEPLLAGQSTQHEFPRHRLFQAASSTVVMSQASAMAKLRRPRIPLNGYKNSSDSARIQR